MALAGTDVGTKSIARDAPIGAQCLLDFCRVPCLLPGEACQVIGRKGAGRGLLDPAGFANLFSGERTTRIGCRTRTSSDW
jgi:hypothetical protein